MAMIKIENLNFSYEQKVIYDKFNLQIEKGKTTVILGESGSGKTTLLHILANLLDYSGEISGIDFPVSFVFQNDRLVKNLTVSQNLKLINKDCKVKDLLAEIGLSDYEDEYVKNLSAGMKRRLAILRALSFNSNIFLFDEPFINLDLKLKYSIMDKIKAEKGEKTLILVTHDIKEAVYLADRIVLLKKGEIAFDITCDEYKKELLENILFQQLMA